MLRIATQMATLLKATLLATAMWPQLARLLNISSNTVVSDEMFRQTLPCSTCRVPSPMAKEHFFLVVLTAHNYLLHVQRAGNSIFMKTSAIWQAAHYLDIYLQKLNIKCPEHQTTALPILPWRVQRLGIESCNYGIIIDGVSWLLTEGAKWAMQSALPINILDWWYYQYSVVR